MQLIARRAWWAQHPRMYIVEVESALGWLAEADRAGEPCLFSTQADAEKLVMFLCWTVGERTWRVRYLADKRYLTNAVGWVTL